jgi:uncharacterized protein (TIGR02996 family)
VIATAAQLLRVIEANFDDADAWLAYADWLQQADAPRGELIGLDIALETEADADRRTALAARRTELLAQRAPALLGDTFAKVVAEGYGTITWRRGFVDELHYTGTERMAHKRAVGWLVAVICEQYPEPFTFVRTLDLAGTDLADVTPLARFTHLTELDISRTAVTDLTPLVPLARLRIVRAGGVPRETLAALRDARAELTVKR